MIWIGSLYYLSSILMLLKWKKWRNQLRGPFLSAGSTLANLGMKSSKIGLRHKMRLFGSKNLLLKHDSPIIIMHTDNFVTMYQSPQSMFVCKIYTT